MSETRDQLIAFIEAEHDGTVLSKLGIRYTNYDPDACTVEVEVGPHLFQHAGIVHGGVYVLLAESAASTASALHVDISKSWVSGMEINANHLRPVREGRLICVASPVHRGKTTHIYRCDVTDQDDRLISVARCTISVRPLPK